MGGGGVLPYIDYTGVSHWPGYGFQAFGFREGDKNQENNIGNRVYNYIKLINSLIQVAINFLERHIDTYRIRVILFSALIRAATIITNRRSHFRERKVTVPFGFWVSSLEQGIKTKLNLV